MRESRSAVSASTLPAFTTSVYSTFPESRSSSLSVSHGSDLGEWICVEQQQKARDLFVCLHSGQDELGAGTFLGYPFMWPEVKSVGFWKRSKQVIRYLRLSPPESQLSSITAFIMTQAGKLQLSL
ncbi:hypothetical protein Q8A73_023173 [Channa argus]|nr:hypothetical protein Q8A73_023173 [Channa argus]